MAIYNKFAVPIVIASNVTQGDSTISISSSIDDLQPGQTVYATPLVSGSRPVYIGSISGVVSGTITLSAPALSSATAGAASYASGSDIAHGLFIDLQLGDTTYYISNVYDAITVNSNQYTALGDFLFVENFVEDYKTTEGTLEISLSGIPNSIDFISLIQGSKIKGGEVSVRRVFFDVDTLVPISGEEYLRYKGVISNFNIDENTNFIAGQSTNTLVFTISSVYTILGKKITGQRTNAADRRRFYPGDSSFDNVINITSLPKFG